MSTVRKIIFGILCLMILGGGGVLLRVLLLGVKKVAGGELLIPLALIAILSGCIGLQKFVKKSKEEDVLTDRQKKIWWAIILSVVGVLAVGGMICIILGLIQEVRPIH